MKVFKKTYRALSVLLVAALVATSTPDVCLTTYAAEGEEVTAEDTASEEAVEVVAEDDAEPAEEDVQAEDDANEELPAGDTESNDIPADEVSDTTDQDTDDGNTAGEEDVAEDQPAADEPAAEDQPVADEPAVEDQPAAEDEPVAEDTEVVESQPAETPVVEDVKEPVDDIIEAQEETTTVNVTYTANENVTYPATTTVSNEADAEFLITAKTGYVITKVTYAVGEGEAVEAQLKADTTDTYVVPRSALTGDVTITATTEAEEAGDPDPVGTEITITKSGELITGISWGAAADNLTPVTFDGNSGKITVEDTSKLTYFKVTTSAAATVSFLNGAEPATTEDNLTHTFFVTFGDVKELNVSAVEKATEPEEETAYTITYAEAENVVYDENNATSVKVSEIEGENFEFVVTPAEYYYINSVTYKVGEAEAVAATKSETKENTYLVPKTAITGNVTIAVTAKEQTTDIAYDVNDSVTYPEIDSAPLNADVELKITAKTGYSLEKVTYTDKTGKEVEAQLKAETTDTYVLPKGTLNDYVLVKAYTVADVYAVTFTPADDNFLYHTYNDAEATFGQDFSFRVRPIGDYALTVTAKVGTGETAKTVTVEESELVNNYYTYTIAAADVTDVIAIDVKATAKQYTATIVKNDDSSIIDKIEYTTKEVAEKTALPEGNEFKVVKKDNITLYVTLKEAAANTRQEVVVTVGEEEVEAVDGAYTIPNDGDVTVTVTTTVIGTKDITVTIPEGVTVKYADDAEATADDLKELDVIKAADGETPAVVGLKGADVAKTYYLFVTAGEGKAIKSVTYGSAVNSELVEAGRAYPITVGETAEVVVAVADSYTVTVDAVNASVLYAEEDTTFEKNKFEEITTVNTANPIYLHVEADENYELIPVYANVTYVADESGEVLEDKAKTLETSGNGNYVVSPEAKAGYTVKSINVTVIAERINHTFTVVSNEAVQILNVTGDVIVTATGAAYEVVVPQGDSFDFYVEVVDDTYNAASTTARYATTQEGVDTGSIVDVYTDAEGKELFSVPSTELGNLYIKGYAEKIPNYAVSFTSDSADVAKVWVKINDAEAVDVAFADNAAITAEMKSGSTFAFKPEFVEDSKYTIKSVTIGEETLTAGEDGYYVIEGGVVAAYEVVIKTELAAENARTIKLNADEAVTISFTDGEVKTLAAGKTYLTETKTEIEFTVDTTEYPGWEIDKVTVGETELTAAEGTYKLPAVEAVGTTQEITITLKAMAATADKYIKFTESENWWFEVGELPEGITAVEDAEGVFKIAKDTRDALTFKVFVPYEDCVTGFEDIDINTIVYDSYELLGEGIERVWAYTFNISSSLIAAGTAEAPTAITPIVEALTYNVTVADGYFKSVKLNGDIYETGNTANSFVFPIGDEVIVEVYPDNYLYIVEDGEETLVELDNLNKYAFTVESDMAFAIKTVEAAKYQVNEKFPYTDYLEGSTTELWITGESDTKLPLYNAEFTDEDAKSTITFNEDRTIATVTADEADAGKVLEVVFTYEEYNEETGRKNVVIADVAYVGVAPIVNAVTVKGVKNKATVKANAGSVLVYPFTIGTHGAYLDLVTVSVTAEGKEKAATEAFFLTEDGVDFLTIVAPEAPEKAKVEIKTNTKEPKTLLTFTVDTKPVAPKVSKVESPLQGYDNLIIKVTADKTFNSAYYEGNLYYALTVTAVEPKANETKPSGVLNSQIFYYPALESTLTKDIEVIKNVDIKKNTAWKFNVTAELVVVKDGVEPIDGKQLDESQVVSVSKSGPKTFSTRNAYYEDKLGLTKKTTSIYQGQEDVLAAVVKFSKKASYITDVTAIAYNADGTEISNGDITIADIDDVTGEVYVSVADNVPSGKYNIVLSADAYKDGYEKTMYRATATLPITVVRSIKSISASVPAQITVTDRKAATITVKPVGYSDEYVKAKTQKFTYELDFFNHDNTALIDAVTIKNNKVTIAKGYKAAVDPQDNMFAIIVMAADYVGNPVYARYVVEVTNENLVLSKAYLIDGTTGEPLDTTLTADQVQNAKLQVLDDDNMPVDDTALYTVKVSNAKAITTYTRWDDCLYNLNVLKAAKNVTFTATTVDGGKKKVVSPKYTINYVPVETIEATWVEDTQPVLVETAANTYEYKGTYNNVIKFDIETHDAEGNPIASIAEPYNNVKVSAKGGKVTLSDNTVSVVPSAEKTSITIKDASTGKKTLTINLTDKAYVKTAGPALKAGNKIYAGYYDASGDPIAQTLKLYINKKNVRYNTMRLIADYGDSLGIAGEYEPAKYYYDNGNSWYYDMNNGRYGYSMSINRPLTAGTYKYTAIYGHYDDGQFIAETKPVTVSIKVDKLATFKPVTSYTITPFAGSWVRLTGKPADVDVTFSDLQNANVKGQPNKFRDYFELYGNDLQLKYDLTYDEIKAINKNDLTGYVTYTYGCGNGTVSKTTKITVKLNMKQVNYTATPINVLSLESTVGSTTILEGKYSEYTMDAKVYAESKPNSTVWTASAPNNYGVNLSAKSPTVGKHTVDLYVVSPSSQYWKDEMTTDEIKALGARVKVTINVYDAKEYTNKITKSVKKQSYDLNHYYFNSYYSSYEDNDYYKTKYDSTANSIQWTLCNNTYCTNKAFYHENMYLTVQNDYITGATIVGDAPKGVALEYIGNNRWNFIVDKEKVEENATIKLSVEVTFANGAKEVLDYTIKTPKKFITLDDIENNMVWDIKYYIQASGNVDNDVANARSEAERMLRAAYSDIKVTNATGKAVKDASGKDTTEVTITLTSKVDATRTKDVVVVLQRYEAIYSQSAERALAIADEYMAQLLDADQAATEGKLCLENTDTKYTIRQNMLVFESATNAEKIDTSRFLVSVQQINRTDATVGVAGSIEIKYSIVDRKTLAVSMSTVTKAIKALEATPAE